MDTQSCIDVVGRDSQAGRHSAARTSLIGRINRKAFKEIVSLKGVFTLPLNFLPTPEKAQLVAYTTMDALGEDRKTRSAAT